MPEKEDSDSRSQYSLSPKEILLAVGATALSIGSLRANDLWVVLPMLGFSWIAFVSLCVLHKSNWKARAVVAIAVTVALLFLAIRVTWPPQGKVSQNPDNRDDNKHSSVAIPDVPHKPPEDVVKKAGGGLKVVDFGSLRGITLFNNSNEPIFVLYAVAATKVPEISSISFPLNAEIGPLKTQDFKFTEARTVSTLDDPATSWEDQWRIANQKYRGCLKPQFFLTSSPQLKQIEAFYESRRSRLQVGDAEGSIIYESVGGHSKEQKFPLKVILVKFNDCTPQ